MAFQSAGFHGWKCWLLPGHDHMGYNMGGEAGDRSLPFKKIICFWQCWSSLLCAGFLWLQQVRTAL